ncbi:MAG: DUF4254 domain-containing protein [Pirellulales bacterium]
MPQSVATQHTPVQLARSVCPVSVVDINRLHRETVALWHEGPIDNLYREFLQAVCEQHASNFRLWHEEDIARSPDVTDERIAEVKRAIDRHNQQRNDRIENLDELLLAQLDEQGIVTPSDAALNTETPGSAIDRLSILALRIFHLEEELARADASEEHRQKVAMRLSICRVQQQDLSAALDMLLDDIFSGRRRLKVYRQLKMYNDPTLNPYLYKARKAG